MPNISQINLELSSRCDKACSFCGHQNPDINTALEYGDAKMDLVLRVREQVAVGTVIQLHRDGEPLVYPYLKEALMSLSGHITNIITNGKKLVEKADEIIGFCDTLTVSAFRGDPDGPEQLEILREFLEIKGDRKPYTMVKWVGDGDAAPYEVLGVRVIRRLIHLPSGDTKYAHHDPTVPEIGVCLDFLFHPSIDWKGNVYICNRLSADKDAMLGNIYEQTLDEMWASNKRKRWLSAHLRGRRDLASPLCHGCKFWGVPSER